MNTTTAEKPIKRISLRLRCNATGKTLRWSIWREPAMYFAHTKSTGPAWFWKEEDGYMRCGPETWALFVPYLRNYFQSYNVTPLQDMELSLLKNDAQG